MRSVCVALFAISALVCAPVMAQAKNSAKNGAKNGAEALTPEQAADRRVWTDELARWNAEHMAAARKLEFVVAALKRHDTGFDLHESEVRAHGTQAGDADTTSVHPQLRTAHEQARNVHDDLMDAVDALTRGMRKNLGKNQSFPDVSAEP